MTRRFALAVVEYLAWWGLNYGPGLALVGAAWVFIVVGSLVWPGARADDPPAAAPKVVGPAPVPAFDPYPAALVENPRATDGDTLIGVMVWRTGPHDAVKRETSIRLEGFNAGEGDDKARAALQAIMDGRRCWAKPTGHMSADRVVARLWAVEGEASKPGYLVVDAAARMKELGYEQPWGK